VLDLEYVKYEANCEQVKGEVEGEPIPWLKGFIEVSRRAKDGDITIVAGAKGGPSRGPLSAEFESGIYVTFDRQGQFKDVGWRVGPEATLEQGPLKVSGEDKIDIGFIGKAPEVPGSGLPIFPNQ
jgi:hypothetical protein